MILIRPVHTQSGEYTNMSKLTIRTTALAHLVAGTSRAELKAVLQHYFPESMAAKKAPIHISWYAGWLKRNPDAAAKYEGVELLRLPVPLTVSLEAVEVVEEPQASGVTPAEAAFDAALEETGSLEQAMDAAVDARAEEEVPQPKKRNRGRRNKA